MLEIRQVSSGCGSELGSGEVGLGRSGLAKQRTHLNLVTFDCMRLYRSHIHQNLSDNAGTTSRTSTRFSVPNNDPADSVRVDGHKLRSYRNAYHTHVPDGELLARAGRRAIRSYKTYTSTSGERRTESSSTRNELLALLDAKHTATILGWHQHSQLSTRQCRSG